MPTTSLDDDESKAPLVEDDARQSDARADMKRAMASLKPREREMLWLAYGQGQTHREIASVLGLQVGSIKMLLFRARRRLAAVMRGGRGDAQ